jgi:hypothetical protein
MVSGSMPGDGARSRHKLLVSLALPMRKLFRGSTPLSARLGNCLESEGLITIGDFSAKSEKDFSNMRFLSGLGPAQRLRFQRKVK